MRLKHYPTANIIIPIRWVFFPVGTLLQIFAVFLSTGLTSVSIKYNQIIWILCQRNWACFLAAKGINLLSMHSLKFSGDRVLLICSFVIKSNKLTFWGLQAGRTCLNHLLNWICYFVKLCWWTHWTMRVKIWNVITLHIIHRAKSNFIWNVQIF